MNISKWFAVQIRHATMDILDYKIFTSSLNIRRWKWHHTELVALSLVWKTMSKLTKTKTNLIFTITKQSVMVEITWAFLNPMRPSVSVFLFSHVFLFLSFVSFRFPWPPVPYWCHWLLWRRRWRQIWLTWAVAGGGRSGSRSWRTEWWTWRRSQSEPIASRPGTGSPCRASVWHGQWWRGTGSKHTANRCVTEIFDCFK